MDPSVPLIPILPSEASRRTAFPPGIPDPETYEHIRAESFTTPSEQYEPPYEPGEEPYGAAPPGREPRGAAPPGREPRGTAPPAGEPRGAPGEEPRGAPGEEPRGAPGEEPRAPGEEPRSAPGPEVSRAPTTRSIPEPETHGHIPFSRSLTPTEEGESRGAPVPGVSRAPTRGIPDVIPRFPSGPGALAYDDAERARQERFGEIERQLADVTQEAAESEMRREHDFQEKETDRDHQFAEKQAEWDRQFGEGEARRDQLLPTLARQPVPPGSGPLPEDMLGVPERAESVIASIRRASTESAARHADDIKDTVQGEREELARQIQAEREEARAVQEALTQQVLAERKRADDERDARMRELEEELARVRAELDHERQQRDHDEEMRREADSQRISERDEETRQQLSEITDLLLAHREEFARKKETVDDRWREKLEWREETNRNFQDLFNMVQGIMSSCAEEKARCEEERRAAEERPCKRKSLVHTHVLTFPSNARYHGRVAKITGSI